ncbi:MAG: methyltransferase domain-containing protein [Planctomycetes bacterium]|nr:methyltransferase domain-containing protein [Planctomycetota bacterium]
MPRRAIVPRLRATELELEHVACDLCGADATRERYKKPDTGQWTSDYEFPVVECLRCGLVYVNPRPTPAGMAPFYANDYHGGRADEVHQRRYARQERYLPPLTNQSILDVGCARGDFLAFLLARHPGLRAVGCDAYSPGVADPRIEFHARALPDCGLPEASFDLVTSWAVFEHLHAPSRSFAEVARVLKPGGRFVFLVTNAESLWSSRAFGEDVPRHTYHYSHRSLRAYAEKHGLGVRRLVCDDRLFDGRGKGTFRWKLLRATGVGFAADSARDLRPGQRLARTAGKLVDGLVFALSWEAWLGRSGMLIAEFEKPEHA